jgi:hypothetical protein
MPDRAEDPDLLRQGLAEAGLTGSEIEQIVLANPRVTSNGIDAPLVDITRPLGLADCIGKIVHLVPPVFGPVNGNADGVRFELLTRISSRRPATQPHSVAAGSLPLTTTVIPTAEDESFGRQAIAAGMVGMVVPAGGTGGRFGGYDLPENHAARQKPLLREFDVGGRCVSSLDVRLANATYWRSSQSARLPLAIMGSPTSIAALRTWAAALPRAAAREVHLYQQHGIYRLDANRLAEDPTGSWINLILRNEDGSPSLKPYGNLGVVTCFILSGVLQAWEQMGIQYIAVANGDDIGFRLDPRIIGHMARNPDVDAVYIAMPWGFAAQIHRSGISVEVRGDQSGWALDAHGTRVEPWEQLREQKFDVGGALQEVSDGPHTRLKIAEKISGPDATFNTNQMYLRIAALRRLVEGTGASEGIEAIQILTERWQPALVEKSVSLQGVTCKALQFDQHLHVLTSALDRCNVVRATRAPGMAIRGTYAPLKRPSDKLFAQLALDAMAAVGDELAFCG